MIARRPRPLCAICAERTADTITDWESALYARPSPATNTIGNSKPLTP